MKKIKGFEKYVEGYKLRIRLLRDVVAAGSQREMADALEIDMKRWNNYERGYPVPREIAFLLKEKFEGFDISWLWYGEIDKLSPLFRKKVLKASQKLSALTEAEAELAKAKKRVETLQGR